MILFLLGAIAGIVVGVILLVIFIGVGTHCVTKACVTSSSPQDDIMNGDLIIPNRGRPARFFNLGQGSSVPKKTTKKYNLPGPEVSILTGARSNQGHVNTQSQGHHPNTNQGQIPEQDYNLNSGEKQAEGDIKQGHISQGHFFQGQRSQNHDRQDSYPQGQRTETNFSGGQARRGHPPFQGQPAQGHQTMSENSQPYSQPHNFSRSSKVKGSASLQSPPDCTASQFPPDVITSQLTDRTMVTTRTTDQTESHLAEVVDTDIYSVPQDEAEPHLPALLLNPRLPPLLPPITATDHSDVPPPPLYSNRNPSYRHASSDSLPPPYDGLQ